MKKLFLKKGSFVNAKATQDDRDKYISVYNNQVTPALVYSVKKGNKITNDYVLLGDKINNDYVLLGDGVTELSWHDMQNIIEIIDNFNQYYNMLNQ